MNEPLTDQTQIAVIGEKVNTIQRDIQEIKGDIKTSAQNYLTKLEFETFKNTEFSNIKKIVYGAVGLLLTAFMLGIAQFFIRKP